MKLEAILGLPEGLQVGSFGVADQMMTLMVTSTQQCSCCPLCGSRASRVHSHYRRQLTDLPCAGRRVRLLLHVRKFFCDEKTCARKIFTERLTSFIEPWARVTTRFFHAMQQIGFATSGMLGARLGDWLGMPASWMTILRWVMAYPEASFKPVVELGIDDFSFRRGRTFGTILVDLQSHQVIDLLPDRSVETVSAWIRAHPKIRLVSRDRGGDYASAATKAAPQARQCADRFHVIKNLGEALQGGLARHLAAHRKQQAEQLRATPLQGEPSKQPPKLSPKEALVSQAKGEERLAKYQQIITLRKQGFSQTAIADRIGIGHATVSRWLERGTFPEQQSRPRKTALEPHLPFLYERWEAGCHNIAQLYRELVARGYSQSYRSAYKQLVRLLPEGRKNAQASDLFPRPPVPARQAVFLFLRRPETLSAQEQETLALLRSLHPEVDQSYELVQQFAHMLRTRTGEQLDNWLEDVRTSKIGELQGFVAGIERDKAAVVAGLTLPQNNGVVARKRQQTQTHQAHDVREGQIAAVASACPACFVISFSQQLLHSRQKRNASSVSNEPKDGNSWRESILSDHSSTFPECLSTPRAST